MGTLAGNLAVGMPTGNLAVDMLAGKRQCGQTQGSGHTQKDPAQCGVLHEALTPYQHRCRVRALRVGVHVLQLQQMVVTLDGRSLVLGEKLLRTLGELAG